MIFATLPAVNNNPNEKFIYQDVLSKAPKARTFMPKSKMLIIERGLYSVQRTMDLSQKGIFVRKMVVSL